MQIIYQSITKEILYINSTKKMNNLTMYFMSFKSPKFADRNVQAVKECL